MAHLWMIFPLKMVIFHSCVSLPEGIYDIWVNYGLFMGNHPHSWPQDSG